MCPSDEIPTLAGLRRGSRQRTGRRATSRSLFDEPLEQNEPPERDEPLEHDEPFEHSPTGPLQPLRDDTVSVDVILAEQARSLYAPSNPNAAAVASAAPNPYTGPQQPPYRGRRLTVVEWTATDAAPSSPGSPAENAGARVWTVGDLVREVRGLMERRYGQVTVDGEISNWRPAASGHCYFTLKDGDAQISAVLFRRQAQLLRFQPRDGDAVRLRGQLSVYESRGQMQLIAESMVEVGRGALLAAVQRLKERLRREGLFDRSRPLPAFPRCIGVVTSLHGAALRDIVKVCRRRHAAVHLLIYPVAVQGPRCAEEVIAGLRWFNAHPDRADVVLVARGGGSWEDLHGFDDEGVDRAIAACALPVLTGIGHATDTTIADAAADVSAPTPSAAAELVTAAQHLIGERVDRLHDRILRAGSYELLRARQRFSRLSAEAALSRWRDALSRREQRLDELGFRAEAAALRALRLRVERLARLDNRLERQSMAVRVAADRHRLQQLHARLRRAGPDLLATRSRQVERSDSRLQALNPLSVLERGYALVYGPDGKLLHSAGSVVGYDTITARLAEGSFRARVLPPWNGSGKQE